MDEKLQVMRVHSEALISTKGSLVGCREIRKHLLQYIKGFHLAKQFRSELCQVTSIEEIHDILDRIEAHHREYTLTPA